MKRCIAFCLALGAALSLTACGGGDTEGGLLYEASGIRPDTVLLSVDGRDVSAQRYLYWLAYACDYIADYYDSGEGIQWGDTVSGQSLEDYAKDQALQNAALYATVETWAEDYGCTLTDEDRTAMDREWAARVAQYGGEEAYLAVLARMGLDRAEAEAISGDYYLYEHLYDLYCTEGSELAPAEHDLETFAQEQGYLTVDHIWLSTAAADPADAEAVAACRARAEEAFSKLNGSADPAHDFAVLAATYSDETDRDQHPSGYTFTVGDGTLPAACEEAAQALGDAFGRDRLLGRIGGDEFCAVIRHARSEWVEERLRRLEYLEWKYNEGKMDVPMRIAYGYAIFDEQYDKNMEETRNRADVKMYEKKRAIKAEERK